MASPLPAPESVPRTRLALPPLVFGTSALGNLYRPMPDAVRGAILAACLAHGRPMVLDCAGKYGAGLALASIGRHLAALGVDPAAVTIGNKLGWLRAPLAGAEPTFEPGAWAGLEHDAVQAISYDGILACWRQGLELLAPYRPALVSVHDPDEYLARGDGRPRRARLADVVEAYRALAGLKAAGEVAAIGIGAKDWRVVAELADLVELDWVMLACSLTVRAHPPEVLALVARLRARGIAVIDSAVFHAGFLVGGEWFDYRRPHPVDDAPLFAWRGAFHAECRAAGIDPAAACVAFPRSVPGVAAIALNADSAARVAENAALVDATIPPRFWTRLKDVGLIRRDFPYLG